MIQLQQEKRVYKPSSLAGDKDTLLGWAASTSCWELENLHSPLPPSLGEGMRMKDLDDKTERHSCVVFVCGRFLRPQMSQSKRVLSQAAQYRPMLWDTSSTTWDPACCLAIPPHSELKLRKYQKQFFER